MSLSSTPLASYFERTDRSLMARWWWTVDKGILFSLLGLIVIGITLVASASPAVATRIGADPNHFITRHIIFVIPATISMLVISFMNHQLIRRIGIIVFAISVFLMILVPFVGADIKGAQRWIPLFGFSLQPSEFIKPSFAIVSAWLISHQKQNPEMPGYALSAGMYALVVTLLLSQPDFGMTVVVTCMFMGQAFLAGLPFRYLVGLVMFSMVSVVLIYFSFGHVQSRIDRFMNPDGADTYQVDRSLEAFSNGFLLGTGPGQGTVKNTIPDAHADFIFSVFAEEYGMILTLGLVGLYGFILLRGFTRMMEASDLFVILAAGGILCMFGMQAFVHMGSSLHLLPTKGMTLPFLSYGGSSILAMGFSMGVVLGLTRRETKRTIARRGLSLSTRV
ncbi:MAG: putative peptidoglycan glycosyltransferase FtsW [Pseudobdellovibrionaceae bacterium]|nr:putative peptidoglycan glycosyltransferase FtsW [Pseudobdellovibrionaceae bacterium]